MYAKIKQILILFTLFSIICIVPGFSDINSSNHSSDKNAVQTSSKLVNQNQIDEFPVTDLLHLLNTTDAGAPSSSGIMHIITGSPNQSSLISPSDELLYILNGSAEINAGSEVMKRFHHQPFSRSLATNQKSWNTSGNITQRS